MKTKLIISAFAFLTAVAFLYQARARALEGSNDFMPLYVAGQLAGTAELYNPAPYIDFQLDRFGARDESLRFTRLPFYAALLAPFGWLDYPTAYGLWVLLRIAAIGAFIALWPVAASWADTLLFASLSMPAYMALMAGQDVIFALPLIALAVRWECSRPLLAGLALCLCAIKFHLFVLVPALIVAQRRWDIGKGLLAGGAALALLSFAAGGWGWPADYYMTLTDNRVHPAVDQMPNLHGLGMPMPVEIGASVLVVLAAWVAMRRTSFEEGLSVALIGGLLLSYHAYVMDCVLLLPALLTVVTRARVEWPRAIAALLLSPIAPILVLGGPPRSYVFQLGLAAFFCSLVLWGLPFDSASIRRQTPAEGRLADAASTAN